MTDQNTPSANASNSPLDVLDQILNDAQVKSAKETEEKEAAAAQKLQEDLARQRVEDQAKIQQELQEIQNMKQSPQYQAMVDQKHDVTEEKEEKAKELDGMEIVQLDHTTL